MLEQVTILQRFKTRTKAAIERLNTVINYKPSHNTKLDLEIAKYKYQTESSENRLFKFEQLSYHQKKLWNYMIGECRDKLNIYYHNNKAVVIYDLDAVTNLNGIQEMKTNSVDAGPRRKGSVPDIICNNKSLAPNEHRTKSASELSNSARPIENVSTVNLPIGIQAFMDRPFPLKSINESMNSSSTTASIPQIKVQPSDDQIFPGEKEADLKSLSPHLILKVKPPPPNPIHRKFSLDGDIFDQRLSSDVNMTQRSSFDGINMTRRNMKSKFDHQ